MTLVLLICGSPRQPSYTRVLMRAVEKSLQDKGATTSFWDLREQPLPLLDPEFHENPAKNPNKKVHELVLLAEKADAFVLGSPVYHNSYSGILKNALDNLAIEQFEHKPCGLLSHGGHRSTQPVDHLMVVVRGLNGIAIPTRVCTKEEDYRTTDSSYELADADIKKRVERFAKELLKYAEHLKTMRAQ